MPSFTTRKTAFRKTVDNQRVANRLPTVVQPLAAGRFTCHRKKCGIYFAAPPKFIIFANDKYQKDNTDGIIYTSKEWGQFYHQYNYSTFENIKSNLNILLGKLLNNGYRKCDDIYPSGLYRTFLKLHKIYRFEAVIVNYFYLSKILEFIPLKKKSLFTHDSFSLNVKSSEHQAAYYLTKEEEKKALSRAPYIFAMQSQPCANNHNILYLSGSSKFNKEGLDWFINDIFPSIKLKYQDAKLYIAGSICNILNEYQDNKDIELVGKIENPYQFFLKGDIAINPCQHGSGLKIKTFEAMSYDKAVMYNINNEYH